MKDLYTTIAGWLFFIAFIPYIVAIVRRQTKPKKSTWLIWPTIDTITLWGMYKTDTLNGQIIGAVAGAWVVCLLAFRFGEPGWTKMDKFCLGGAGLGVILVLTYPTIGIAASLFVLLVGSMPTIQQGWAHPEKEDKLAWTVYFASCIFALMAIPQHPKFEDVAQPVVFSVVETTMMYLLYLHRGSKDTTVLG